MGGDRLVSAVSNDAVEASLGNEIRQRQSEVYEDLASHLTPTAGATELLEAGVDLFSIQKILGHTSLCMTARYTHVRRNHLQEACKSLDLLPLEQLRQGPAPTPPRKPGRRSKSAKSSAATEPRSSQPADPD